MAPDQFSCSIISSVLCIALYLGLCWYYKQKADLTHGVIIAISMTGLVAACALGSLTMSSSLEQIGVFRDHKPSILIGTLAMIWVSVTTAHQSVMHPVRSGKRQSPAQPDAP
ncbi:hypothetical protein [Pseudomonas sp. CLCA07]